ncbi:MAG: acetyltransferase [Alkaliphilus sp.]
MKNKLLIVGASGHGKVVADVALKMNKWESIAFLDDGENIKASMGIEVVGKFSDTFEYKNDYNIFPAIGNNATRETIMKQLETAGASVPILIHPSAIIGEQVELGMGTVVMGGVVINCCTKIGKGCIINTGATIDHDNTIEDYVHISPGANLAGTVKVGKGTWVGIGSAVSNNINIISSCKIGAGAVVVKDINEVGTYAGVPARRVANGKNTDTGK